MRFGEHSVDTNPSRRRASSAISYLAAVGLVTTSLFTGCTVDLRGANVEANSVPTEIPFTSDELLANIGRGYRRIYRFELVVQQEGGNGGVLRYFTQERPFLVGEGSSQHYRAKWLICPTDLNSFQRQSLPIEQRKAFLETINCPPGILPAAEFPGSTTTLLEWKTPES